MKALRYLLIISISILLFSCEKVIDVDVDDAAKRYVIEGTISNEAGGCRVRISQTRAINEDNSFVGVSGAKVLISDEHGLVTELVEGNAGIYQSTLIGEPGKKYSLLVTIAGESYSASSQMPEPVAVDSLYVSIIDMMGEKDYYANVVFSDPIEKGNAYRFVQYVNGEKSKELFVQNDELSNGRKNTYTLYNHHKELAVGDKVKVDVLSIDPQVYKYWNSLNQGATGDGGAASPANPVSNLSNGALGYFSAHSVTSKSAAVE